MAPPAPRLPFCARRLLVATAPPAPPGVAPAMVPTAPRDDVAPAPSAPRLDSVSAPPATPPRAQAMEGRRLPTPTPTPTSSSSTPEPRHPNELIPGLRPVVARSPTPAPPGFGGHDISSRGGGGGPVRLTMAARRNAAPFYNSGTAAGRSAATPPPARAPARWNATAAANRRPGLIRTWVNVPHGDAARRLPNGVHHQEPESSSTTGSTRRARTAPSRGGAGGRGNGGVGHGSSSGGWGPGKPNSILSWLPVLFLADCKTRLGLGWAN
ncbi:hypothetical protein C2845_PM05G28900 [Panicum miliaceum]|uniref:Uncharacterized protein n=1 Tax=Panicum miliaceum TaxID=4540 RepID=A0A3L6T5Q8_PANMI|nr:hypothetical protein C2845_PM05G28900 [Panicum miliaceum]